MNNKHISINEIERILLSEGLEVRTELGRLDKQPGDWLGGTAPNNTDTESENYVDFRELNEDRSIAKWRINEVCMIAELFGIADREQFRQRIEKVYQQKVIPID